MIRPSNAKAWRYCAMQPTMVDLYPEEPHPIAQEGTAAHWVFAQIFNGKPVNENDVAPNGIVITEEMLEGAELLIDTVNERMSGQMLHVEETLAVSGIPLVAPGTPDIWSFNVADGIIEVIDYKFGYRFVDEYENDQAICYVEGILESLSQQIGIGPGVLDQGLRVNFTIVQPRCYYASSSVRTWSFRAYEIRGQVNALKMAAEKTTLPEPVATTNSECGDCPGRHACPALQKAAYSDAEFAYQGIPVELPTEAASLELKLLERSMDRISARVDGLRESLLMQIKQGKQAPFHSVTQGFGRTRWTGTPQEVIELGVMFNIKLAKDAVVTPKQAAKLGIDDAVISAYSETPMGQLKLVPQDNKQARRIFSK